MADDNDSTDDDDTQHVEVPLVENHPTVFSASISISAHAQTAEGGKLAATLDNVTSKAEGTVGQRHLALRTPPDDITVTYNKIGDRWHVTIQSASHIDLGFDLEPDDEPMDDVNVAIEVGARVIYLMRRLIEEQGDD